jgi:hypothetical protein
LTFLKNFDIIYISNEKQKVMKITISKEIKGMSFQGQFPFTLKGLKIKK